MVSDRKVGDAVGGKSVRACDNCARKRARWYCAADDAFLCESCDSTVHSANPLARRHERLRLNTTSRSPANSSDDQVLHKASWHQGFTRKPRTPRQKKIGNNIPLHLQVPEPEVCSEDENEEQLLYRVPVFVPTNTIAGENSRCRFANELQFQETLPSELDLAEFAADVESLLGKGFEDESFDMEGLGIFDGELEIEADDCCWLSGKIKAEDGEVFDEINRQIDLEQEHRIPNQEESECKSDDSNKAFLKLDYERVMSAWDDSKSPWTTGDRPAFTSADCCFGRRGGEMHMHADASGDVAAAAAIRGDGGREARVSRYREKRRTRLFSKKIRYEVRKLNAEKRPRMKGRFVKRASLAASAFP